MHSQVGRQEERVKQGVQQVESQDFFRQLRIRLLTLWPGRRSLWVMALEEVLQLALRSTMESNRPRQRSQLASIKLQAT
ncbi:hypothetical protein DSL72_003906 [Monilinia vaccinii-corymbosi]|uniref:Uncharacterized protein n=1 Tax=Monilinia vaccinii-corymbosi TaxID=61207 RepID=A0A8A3NXZ9_9HELO|nr:hypothetical protein DSL72_003906 [Monilinia vaccinii-corymbosi]